MHRKGTYFIGRTFRGAVPIDGVSTAQMQKDLPQPGDPGFPAFASLLERLAWAFDGATAITFDRRNFELHRFERIADLLPFTLHETGDSRSLLDLINPADHEAVMECMALASVTTTASRPVALTSGEPVTLTLLSTRPWNDRYGLALVEHRYERVATPPLHAHMRLYFDTSGVLQPQSSWATRDHSLEPWAIDILDRSSHQPYLDTIDSVVSRTAPFGELFVHTTVESTYRALVVPAGDAILVDLVDSSAKAERESLLEATAAQFELLSETLPVGVFVVGRVGELIFGSREFHEMFGDSADSMFGWTDRIRVEDHPILEQAINGLSIDHSLDIEIHIALNGSDYSPCRVIGRDVRDDAGLVRFVVGFVEDLTEQKELRRQVVRATTIDDLTALPNRNSLSRELRARLSTDNSRTAAVLFIDLDGFKLINDTQGHTAGDIVLLEVAQRIRRAIRPSDVVARFGGDEFVVVTDDLDGPHEAGFIAQRLHDVLAAPILVDGRTISVTASVGVATAATGATTPDQLIGDADLAMYEAKARGRNQTVVFDTELRAKASRRFDMTTDLRHAARRRELRLDYQPIVELETGNVTGAEALVRWAHPTIGLIGPSSFVNLAEEIGLIPLIGDWVLDRTCADLAQLIELAIVPSEFRMNVNVSAAQFQDIDAMVAGAKASVARHGLHPSNIRFELTESVPLSEIPGTAKRIRRLTAEGFTLAIDDFGTGYSSLGYLTQLPFDMLKLDLSLTAELASGSAALAVVESLNDMADNIGFHIVAEGIETRDQHQLLAAAGVTHGQGYLFSQPIPIDALTELLQSQTSLWPEPTSSLPDLASKVVPPGSAG